MACKIAKINAEWPVEETPQAILRFPLRYGAFLPVNAFFNRETSMRRLNFQIAGQHILSLLLASIGMAATQNSDAQQLPYREPDAQSGPMPLAALPEKLLRELEGTTPLNPEGTVLLNVKSKSVILRTEVACRDCILEMLLVPEGNREHETILRIRSKAYVIHTNLLALGLEPGKPAEFSPDFVAPTGPTIQLQMLWLDEKGLLQRADVSDWVRHNVHRYYSSPLSGPPPGLQLPYKNLRFLGQVQQRNPVVRADDGRRTY